ncbi:hypothetical protein H6G81_33450 [Scytonema hofmannii FACHB-248]|uniref:Uncharacterized protein n=1 Tax=Scytonema hofmannii FACHB-248 TaxID=1842502 RepID=A0ABR8H0D6_9CYAN|nr:MULTISPECIES: hypothetical protein [Nostocales]MBD2609281.1 hypothetical protein [Scytonema hofmannii FACHB-248]
MAITVEKALLNNQSILQYFALVEEIDEQAAEIISGGGNIESFKIINGTQQPIYYTVDGVEAVIQPGQEQDCSTNLGGKIRFDRDIRDNKIGPRGYNLEDGKAYAFLADYKTSSTDDINLYQV